MNIVPISKSPVQSQSIAYGRHGEVQVFEGCEAAWEECREIAERIMSFEPRNLFFVVDDGESVLMVRASGEPPAARRPSQIEMFSTARPGAAKQLPLF